MARCWLVLPLIAALAGCPSTKGSSGPDSGSTPANHQARGPRIRLGAASIAFGQVPLFSGESVTTVRKLVVFNEGDAELAIQKVELSAPDTELEVGTAAGWEPGDLLGARAGSNAMEFELRLTPKALGKKSWELLVSSNDPTAAQLRIPISAEVIPSLPCNVTVTPSVSLPQVAPPEVRVVPVQIHNEGTSAVEQCLLKNLRLEGGDASFISLPDGGLDQRLLRANETLEKRVQERTEELTRLNAALARAKRDAEAANVSKTKFIAAASHDILQPLNAARLYVTSLLERRAQDDRKLVENIDASLDAVEEIFGELGDDRWFRGTLLRLLGDLGSHRVKHVVRSLVAPAATVPTDLVDGVGR